MFSQLVRLTAIPARVVASSSNAPRPGASTPGDLHLANCADLRVGQWNVGLPSPQLFSKDGKIHEHLRTAAARIRLMAEFVHVVAVALNELHPKYQEELDKSLGQTSENLQMVAVASGDVLIWCHTARSSRLGGCYM